MSYEPRWMKELRKLPGGARVIAKYQRPTDPNAGERLPDFVHATGHGHFRLDVPKPMAYVKCVGPTSDHHVWPDPTGTVIIGVLKHCERCGAEMTLDALTGPCVVVSWWYCDPLGHWGWLAAVTEHEDGTITVTGIDNRGPYDEWWRGAIHAGVWRGHVLRVEASH